jgi:hypothetical protein
MLGPAMARMAATSSSLKLALSSIVVIPWLISSLVNRLADAKSPITATLIA